MSKIGDTHLIPHRLSLGPVTVLVSMENVVGTIVMKKFFIGFLAREDVAPGY